MGKNLTEGSVIKQLFMFAVPIFGANLLQALYGTVDLMVVGWFADAAAVSAVSTGSMTMQTITGIITGLTMGCTVLLGQSIGRKDHPAAGRAIGSAVWLFSLTGAALAVLMIAAAGIISGWMNAPEEAFAQTAAYVRICGGGAVFIVLFNAISGMFRGIGDSKTPLFLMIVACVGNIIGDIVFVGILSFGSAGAALATVIAQAASVVCAFLLIRRNGFGFPFHLSQLKPAGKETVQILRFGLPIAAQDALTGISFMVILAILNGFGLTASAGVGVAEKLCGLMFIVPGAIMAAVSAFSAQNVGAGKQDRAKQGMLAGMAITFAAGLVMFAFSYTKGIWMARIFTSDQAVCEAAADFLKSYSVDCIIVGFNFSMMGYFNGNGRTAFVAAQGIMSAFLIRIPVSYFMSRIPGVSLFQVGFATPLATVFAIVISLFYYYHMERVRKQNIPC